MTAAAFAPAISAAVERPAADAVLLRRALRLETLQVGHPFGDYLAFVGHIVAIQRRLVAVRAPWPQKATQIASEIAALGGVPPETKAAATAAARLVAGDVAVIADRWLNGTSAPDEIAVLPFVLAGLQLERQKVAHASAVEAEFGRCSTCGGPPLVATLDTVGDADAVRHLHCALCADVWRVERLRCLACGSEGSVQVFAFEADDRPVKAEACGSCGRYLKTFAPAGLDGFEALADDLASFDLDFRLGEQGLRRVTSNPFLVAA
jgi:FdhE protein